MDRQRVPYSVLMSVYEKENPEYFRQSVESILNQTLPSDNFVLVCDGPLTPALESVLEVYKNALQIVRLPENHGLGIALNEGLKHCRYELVARMDSDDISFPTRCEQEVAAFEETPNLDILSSTLLEFEDDPEKITGKRELPADSKAICAFSRKRCPFNHPTVMFRKSAVESAGGYQGTYRMEDYYLWIRMLQNGAKGKNLAEPLLYMRTPHDMYLRRGGKAYAKDMLRFHWWLHKTKWSSLADYFTGAVPHALVCMLPNRVRRIVYKLLHK
ncbi:glycosyltransferase family 2 protein [Allofournierella sp.]|uniref:glycosyltransferase family 2 protein n=1 Tax=Allofournierella sp. TaxID=1940256 RepID=UPI003AB79626